MRLLLVSQDFPPDVGGIQTYSLELARRLAPRCEVLEVIAPAVPGHEAVDEALPFPVRRVRSSTDALVVRGAPALWRRARDGRFDAALHAQWTTAPGSLLARRRGWPRRVFVAAHGRELLLRPIARVLPAQAAYDAARRGVVRGADGLFAVSRYTAGLLRAMGVEPGRVHVVENGVDATRFALPDAAARIEGFRARHGLGTRPCFTTVARLQAHKGIDTGIRALPALRQQVPEATYVIVGSGPDEARLRGLAQELGVSEATRFLGRVSDDEVVDALLACDVFVLLSREANPDVEGFGLVLLEAGACERPVIGARSGGIPDAIAPERSGLLVPPDDVVATVDALTRVLGDRELARRLGQGGLQRATAELTWDRAAGSIFDTIAGSL